MKTEESPPLKTLSQVVKMKESPDTGRKLEMGAVRLPLNRKGHTPMMAAVSEPWVNGGGKSILSAACVSRMTEGDDREKKSQPRPNQMKKKKSSNTETLVPRNKDSLLRSMKEKKKKKKEEEEQQQQQHQKINVVPMSLLHAPAHS